MLHHIDIYLRPDPEFPAHMLLSALHAKLHRALVQLNTNKLGVSFPGYSERPAHLGSVMRIFGPATELAKLTANPWLAGMSDHVNVGELLPVPSTATHQKLTRVQAKSNPERLRRRHMKRHGLTEQQALERIPDSTAETLNLPFLVLRSTSTGQTFRMFLRLEKSEMETISEDFNAYGLSPTATTPWF